jgi:hypothetical protein
VEARYAHSARWWNFVMESGDALHFHHVMEIKHLGG